MIRFITFTFTLILATSCSLYGQTIGAEVGAQLGVAHYFGDINPDHGIHRPGLTAGILGRYSFNNRIAFRASMNYAKVSGFDSDSENEFQQIRNLNFKSDIINATLQGEFNFLPFVHGDVNRFFSPYLFGGASISYFNPQTELNGTKYSLRELGTEGQAIGDEYDFTTLGWYYGAGIKYSITYHWSINVELGVHQLFTDYLDDLSTVYPDPIQLEADRGDLSVALSDRSATAEQQAIGAAGRQRGNSATNDSYAVFNIGVTYFLGKLKCPPISKKY